MLPTTSFVAVYLLIGILWLALLIRVHPAADHLRRMVGDARTFLVFLPVILFWPIEVFALLVYFAIVLLNVLRLIWREGRRNPRRRFDDRDWDEED